VTDVQGKGAVKRVVIEATVIRADGTREELGTVADSQKRWRFGPGRLRAWWRIKQANRRMKHGDVRS
jgi:hypothetical protein